MLGWFKRKLKKSKDEPSSSVEEQVIASPEEELAELTQEESEVIGQEGSPFSDEETFTEQVQQDSSEDHEPENILTEEPEDFAVHTSKEQKTSADEDSSSSELSEEDLACDSEIEEPEERAEEEQPVADYKIKVRRENEPFSTPEPKKAGLFKRLSEKLSRTRESFTYQIDSLFLGKKVIDEDLLDELEEILITADIGITITQELLEHARRKVKRNELSDPESLKQVLKKKIKQYIVEHDKPAELVMPAKGPFVIMVVGVNGVGKTTTIGKIAHKFIQSGQSVLLVAGDTFRAAAVSQLTIWAERNGVDIVSKENADPSSVAFDAMAKAQSGNYDVVLVDTAGRLHTQENLMDELKKIKRVIGKQLPGAPHEVMLVIDATTGQNGVSQAKLFDAAVDITGITLTKLDGTAKGGIVANIAKEMKTPIRFIGIGEQIDDLRDFNADEFIEALFQSKQ